MHGMQVDDKLVEGSQVPEPKYLFVLNIAYCGSTAFANFLLSSSKVWSLTGRAEGQWIKSIRPHFRNPPWDTEKQIPWPEIRQIWLQHWRSRVSQKPGAYILLEKSPTLLPRAAELNHYFAGSSFVAFIRNPYAWCASYDRHEKCGFGAAARVWLKRAHFERQAIEAIPTMPRLNYEEFVADPASVRDRLQVFMPDLDDLRTDVEMEVKHYPLSGIADHNERQIGAVPRKGLKRIRNVLDTDPEIVRFFGYDLDPPQVERGRA
jgi:hypothetical protein